MEPCGSRVLGLTLIFFLLATSLASPAFARGEDDEDRPPYDVQGLPHKRVWVPWVFAFLFAAACVAAAFKNPHRVSTERT